MADRPAKALRITKMQLDEYCYDLYTCYMIFYLCLRKKLGDKMLIKTARDEMSPKVRMSKPPLFS